VTAVYDLLREHKCSIVRAQRLPIHHCLLSRERFLKDVREIYSHEQALGQCGEFLDRLGDRVKITVCENTAMAARMAAQSEQPGAAAISSEECAELYGLNILKRDIQSAPRNETRFICIARQAEIFPGAHKSSVLLSLQHRPGSLAELLQLIAGMNLTKLESRPTGSDYEVLFYLDMECNAVEHTNLLEEMQRHCASFLFLGSYAEEGA
jgi:chorismate mutase/prephenate dehydratase